MAFGMSLQTLAPTYEKLLIESSKRGFGGALGVFLQYWKATVDQGHTFVKEGLMSPFSSNEPLPSKIPSWAPVMLLCKSARALEIYIFFVLFYHKAKFAC